jgi:hypothetical protein
MGARDKGPTPEQLEASLARVREGRNPEYGPGWAAAALKTPGRPDPTRETLEDRLETLLTDVDAEGDEASSRLSRDIAESVRRLGGRMIHGAFWEFEKDALEAFMVDFDKWLRERAIALALEVETDRLGRRRAEAEAQQQGVTA